MPLNSLYYPIKTTLEKTANPSFRFTPTPEFARKLVTKVLRKKKPPIVYIGARLWMAYLLASLAWFAGWFVGVRFWDFIGERPWGMRELKMIVRGREKAEREKKKLS